MFVSRWRALALALTSAMAFAAAPSLAATVFYDSFESPVPDDGRWQVYQQVGDSGAWSRRNGAGIEIQTNRAIGLTDAHTGTQYIELDSDRRKGGDNLVSNSAMITTLFLNEGVYDLSWWYRARTNTAGDNKIDVYLSELGGGNPFGNLLASMDKTRSETPDWVNSISRFSIDTAGEYDLIIGAFGRQTANTLGGFVDTVELTALPLPASVPLPAPVLLLGVALGGLGLAARRRRTT